MKTPSGGTSGAQRHTRPEARSARHAAFVVGTFQRSQRCNFRRIEIAFSEAFRGDHVTHSRTLICFGLGLLLLTLRNVPLRQFRRLLRSGILPGAASRVLVFDCALLAVFFAQALDDVHPDAAVGARTDGLADGRAARTEVLDVVFSLGHGRYTNGIGRRWGGAQRTVSPQLRVGRGGAGPIRVVGAAAGSASVRFGVNAKGWQQGNKHCRASEQLAHATDPPLAQRYQARVAQGAKCRDKIRTHRDQRLRSAVCGFRGVCLAAAGVVDTCLKWADCRQALPCACCQAQPGARRMGLTLRDGEVPCSDEARSRMQLDPSRPDPEHRSGHRVKQVVGRLRQMVFC